MSALRRGAALALAVVALGMALAPAALAAKVLEVGSSGSDVTAVQKKLIQWGYLTGSADGKYGEKTRRAVASFQRKNGLTADGRVVAFGDNSAGQCDVTDWNLS